MATKILKTLISFVLLFIVFVIGIYFIFPDTSINALVELERKAKGGKGETLVLLHGFGANKDNWTRLAKYLMSHYRIIAPDLPGFGESSSPNDIDYTVAAQV